jgi:hypothetical protein
VNEEAQQGQYDLNEDVDTITGWQGSTHGTPRSIEEDKKNVMKKEES